MVGIVAQGARRQDQKGTHMIKGYMPVDMLDVFPNGAFVVSVEAKEDFDKRMAKAVDTQARDKDSGQRLWSVRVIDGDEDAQKRGQAEVTVTVLADVQPIPPEAIPGTPFRPAHFEGLTMFAYSDDSRCKVEAGKPHKCRARVAYAFRASGLRSPGKPVMAKSAA